MRIKVIILLAAFIICGADMKAQAEETADPRLACAEVLSHLKMGISRAEFDRWTTAASGLFNPFTAERAVVLCPGASLVPMSNNVYMDVTFKPAGMSDEMYYLGNQRSPAQQPGDTLMSVSTPYVQGLVIDKVQSPAKSGPPAQLSGAAPLLDMAAAVAKATGYARDKGMNFDSSYLSSAIFYPYHKTNYFPGHTESDTAGTYSRSWEVTWQVPNARGGTTIIYVFEDGTFSVLLGE